MPRRKKETSVAEALVAEDAKAGRGRAYVPRYGETEPQDEPVSEVSAEAPEPVPEVAASPKPKPGTKKSRAHLQTLTTDGDLVDIWERRILNPDFHESIPIRIKTPGMKIRWINLSSSGRYHRARYEQGWVPVTQGELVDEREIFGASFTSEGHVCRGAKQSEMLMKIPLAVFRKIMERRAQLNVESYKKLKTSMGSAGYEHFKGKYGGSAGDQAAEAANRFKGSVKFGTEKVSSDELYEI